MSVFKSSIAMPCCSKNSRAILFRAAMRSLLGPGDLSLRTGVVLAQTSLAPGAPLRIADSRSGRDCRYSSSDYSQPCIPMLKCTTSNLPSDRNTASSAGNAGSPTAFECGDSRAIRLAFEVALHGSEIGSRNRVADQQHAREVVSVGVGEPDVGPLDVLTPDLAVLPIAESQ